MEHLGERVQNVQPWGQIHQMHEGEQFLKAHDVGRILDVDRSTVHGMAESGHLPAMKVGRQWRELYHLDDNGRAKLLTALPMMAARLSLLAAKNLSGIGRRSAS